ncbi:MAG TPA: biotin/lipoate A/B protein ligase family protein [Chitinivibrionales bacterium]
MSPALRVIVDKANSPAMNMAADLWLLQSCLQGSEVVVRLYEWEPASITLGYMQHASETLDREALFQRSVAWIRRPTGGRAVLHHQDITYSCIFPETIVEMGKTVMETYDVIAKCLMAGLMRVGIECAAMDSFDQMRQTKRDIKLPCFLAPNRNEIMVNGRKLVGSAQKRSNHAVLQHGSIPLSDAYRRLPDFLQISDEQRLLQKQLLRAKSICLQEIDSALTMAQLYSALVFGFTAVLPFEARQRPWTAEELESIETMATDEHFKETWMPGFV